MRMSDYKVSFGGRKGGKKFGRDRGEQRSFGGGRSEDRPALHKAVCGECGKDCEVPFRPVGDRPVFCRDCFRKRGDDFENSSDRGPRREGGNRDFGNRDSRPSQHAHNGTVANYKTELEQINITLNKILKILTVAVSGDANKSDM